jgi:DNA polymerase I
MTAESKRSRPIFDPKKTVFLIDGSSFLYRAYYGVRPMHTSAGIPVQAIYNFCRMIRKLLDSFKPRFMAIVWDSPGKTERHELYQEYKATRQAPPSDLFAQKEKIIEFANLLNIKQVAQTGVEADDLIYSIAKDRAKVGDMVVMITSDKDMGQLLDGQVLMYDWFKDEFIDAKALEEKLGFSVEKIPFYYALIGDTSDNIPGVSGVGKVTATDLVQQFESLEDLYNNLDKVKREKLRGLLVQHRDDAFLSQNLFKLRYHKLGIKKDELFVEEANWGNARPLFQELEFTSLLKDLEKLGYHEETQKLSEAKGYKFICVTDEQGLQEVVDTIKQKKAFAFDTEADQLGALTCNMVGLSICVEQGVSYYIPFGHSETALNASQTTLDSLVHPGQQTSLFAVPVEGKTSGKQLSRDFVVEMLKPVFADVTIAKYAHHAKHDMLVISQYGLEAEGLVFDTLLAAHLVTEDWQRISLKHLSKFYLQETMLTFDQVVSANGYKDFSQVPLDLATEYAAADAHQTFRLVPILQEALKASGMEKLYYEIEHPAMYALFHMEREGIYLDPAILERMGSLVAQDIGIIEQKIIALLGGKYQHVNLNSPKQLEKLLFQDLGLPTQRKTKTGFSTDQDVLEILAKIHPVPGLIIKWRELAKLQGTYIQALPTYINKRTGRIHTTFSQTSVATGRLASYDPNLQNIPVHTAPYDVQVRTAFQPQEGHVFLSADYSQIELRVLAFLSQDQSLMKAFAQGTDIHTQTAAKLFDVEIAQVTNEQRQLGKRINFSILYGMTPYGLSQDLGITFSEAKRYIERYFDQYPGVSAWMEKVIEETKKHGYVTTFWGRRRYVPGIYEKNHTLYELAKRIAINTAAQGTAAELMKQGMVNLEAELAKSIPEARILLQIHDELIISVPQPFAQKAQDLAKKTLEAVVSWSVPLVVESRVGESWQEVTK